MAEIDWKREFEQTGAKGVRAALISSHWDNQKRAAAREWLERNDASEWQSSRRGQEPTGTTFDAFRRYKWIYYIAGGAFGLLGVAQIVGKLF
jgi:hypothetical protein